MHVVLMTLEGGQAHWFEPSRRCWTPQRDWWYAAATDRIRKACFPVWQSRRIVQKRPRSGLPFLPLDFFRNSALLHTSMPGSRVLSRSPRDNSAPH